MDTRLLDEIEEAKKSDKKLIVMLGKKHSGKDASLENTSLYKYTMKMAHTLKLMVNCLLFDLGFSGTDQLEMLEGSAKEVQQDDLFGKNCRHLMQTLGTEWGRKHIHGDLWNLVFLKKYNRSIASTVIITDCRFPNEYELLKELGATFIRITRPSLVSTDEHISETALDGFPVDHEIINDGTIEDLQNKVGAIINGS